MRVPLVQQASWEQLGESSKPIHTCDYEGTAFSALPTRFVGCVSCLCLPVAWSDPTHLTAVGLSQVEKVPTRKASKFKRWQFALLGGIRSGGGPFSSESHRVSPFDEPLRAAPM